MAFVRLYTGPDGKSHFGDASGYMKPGGTPDSEAFISVKGMTMRHWTGQTAIEWHPAPRRQFAIILSGEMEVEIGDGSKRRFKAGDVLLAEDTTGQGHITRRFGDYRIAVVHLA